MCTHVEQLLQTLRILWYFLEIPFYAEVDSKLLLLHLVKFIVYDVDVLVQLLQDLLYHLLLQLRIICILLIRDRLELLYFPKLI